MNFLNTLTILLFSSLAGIGVLFVWRYRFIKNFTREDLYEGIIYSKPFFSDFAGIGESIIGIIKKMSLVFKIIAESLAPWFKRVAVKPKLYYYRFSNYLHGRRVIEKNGCSGYWQELKECQNGGKEETERKDCK